MPEMKPAEMEAIIAELEAGFLAECECEECKGHGVDEKASEPCSWCGGLGVGVATCAGERAAAGIRARQRQRAEAEMQMALMAIIEYRRAAEVPE